MGVLLTSKDREAYLQEEVRSDYTVSSNMKEVWLFEMEMLDSFIRICNKYDLKWQMVAGSLLGTIRHDGFIPWDDDIDVAMPRPDYDRFLEVAQKELESEYFLQTSLTDPGRCIGYAQIRNSSTSAIDLRYVDEDNRWNQGIFIDIFVLDGIPSDEQSQKSQKDELLQWNRIYKNAFRPKTSSLREICKKLAAKLIIAFNGGLKRFYEKREGIYRRYSYESSDLVGMLSFIYDDKRYRWKREDLENTTEHKYEFITVKVPVNYEKVLQTSFGDWHICVKGTANHEGLDFDCHKSYNEFLVEKYNYKPFK